MLVDTTFIVHYLFSPCSADDISSDFTLRGINVQCIHGDRYSIINLQHVWLINVFIVCLTHTESMGKPCKCMQLIKSTTSHTRICIRYHKSCAASECAKKSKVHMNQDHHSTKLYQK